MSESTKLSSSTTVAQYRTLEAAGDRKAIGQFFVERFDERYFRPIEDSSSKHGFAVLAVACLVIETLESFYQGRPDTKNVSTQMFRDFLARDTPLKVLAGGDDGSTKTSGAASFIKASPGAVGAFFEGDHCSMPKPRL